LPVVPGHEFAGVVVGQGADVRSPAVGARVAVDPNLPCRRCDACRRGRTNLCADLSALGISRDGAAARYVAAPAAVCVEIPASLDLGDAALIEPLSCAVRGVDVLGSHLGATVLVVGAGTMGLMMQQLAARSGAAAVDVVEVNPQRRATADRFGTGRSAASIDEIDQPQGWDVVIEATGAPAAIATALSATAAGGTFLQFGVAPPDAEVSIRPYEVYRRELTIVGSMAVLNSFQRAATMLAGGFVDTSVLITDRRPLEEYPAALAAFADGVGLKTHVLP